MRRYRNRLGNSGLYISKVILGTASSGSPEWQECVLEEEDALPLLKHASTAELIPGTLSAQTQYFSSFPTGAKLYKKLIISSYRQMSTRMESRGDHRESTKTI
jgi:hypothetical protein